MINSFFAPIKITLRELRSRELRKFSTGGSIGGLIRNPVSDGIRRVNVDELDTEQFESTDPVTGRARSFLGRVLDPIKKYLGFAWSAIVRLVKRSFSEIWSTIVTAGFSLWTFDWNQTDAAIRNQINQNNQQVLNAAAGALGTTLGWGAVRLVQMGVAKIFGNTGGQGRDRSLDIRVPVISGRVSAALAEEGNEETRGALQALLMQIKAAQTRNAFLGFMLTSRANGWFGQQPITTPGANDTFAQRWEKKVESLPQWLQQPVENFTENFVEAILEAGFIWSAEADSAYALSRAAMRDAAGPERTIVLQPDNRLERDRYIVKGSQQFVVEETERIINQQQLLGKRDIGYWVGEKLEDSLKKAPLVRQLKIRWNTVKEPPLVQADGSIGRWSECNIPKVKFGITWQEVKSAADDFLHGGTDGNWIMQYSCYERDNYIGNLVVKGINIDECERRVKKLKQLMPGGVDLRKPRPTRIAPTSSQFRTDLARFYPIEASLTVRRNSIDDAERRERRGRVHVADPDDRYFDDVIKVELWPVQEPEGFPGFR